jgi:hypothetical protein
LWYSMIHPADRSAVENAVNDILADREVLPVEHRLIRRDGRTIWIRNTMVPYLDKQGRLTRYDGVVEDISTRKHTEDHLLYAQKMESLGRMAGAIAHNFNNIIAIILGTAEMVQMGLASDSSVRPRIGHILEACRRAHASLPPAGQCVSIYLLSHGASSMARKSLLTYGQRLFSEAALPKAAQNGSTRGWLRACLAPPSK